MLPSPCRRVVVPIAAALAPPRGCGETRGTVEVEATPSDRPTMSNAFDVTRVRVGEPGRSVRARCNVTL